MRGVRLYASPSNLSLSNVEKASVNIYEYYVCRESNKYGDLHIIIVSNTFYS